jgi:DNA end-binding protein Ku
MARSLWSGSISFGLVNVPVKMVTAVSPNDIHFHQLRESDGARIQYKKVSSTDQKEVDAKSIVKGYEVSPNQYVKLKPEELDALESEKSRTIEIQSFVDLKQIDPIYFERSYYLEPDKNAGKAYALLQDTMNNSDKVGIAKMVLHNREHLVALRGSGNAIVLSTLYFHDELIPEKELELPAKADKPQKKELEIALQLVEAIGGKFEPEKYHDEYRARVMELIHQKAEGKQVVVQSVPKTSAPNVINLMDALKASIAESSRKRKSPEKAEHRTSKPKSRKSA